MEMVVTYACVTPDTGPGTTFWREFLRVVVQPGVYVVNLKVAVKYEPKNNLIKIN